MDLSLHVALTNDGIHWSTAQNVTLHFQMDKFHVYSVSPVWGPASGGTNVTISGAFFDDRIIACRWVEADNEYVDTSIDHVSVRSVACRTPLQRSRLSYNLCQLLLIWRDNFGTEFEFSTGHNFTHTEIEVLDIVP